MQSHQPVVPRQKTGARSDTHYSVRASNEHSASQLFQNARLNLLNVNGWHSLSGSGACFQLVNEKGEEINGLVEQGNYFRIRIPGIPGSKEGAGDEWVRVEKVEEGKLRYHEFTAIRVRPAAPPFTSKTEAAHFFSTEATSSFCVVRNSNRITASVLGRNEKPNTKTRHWSSWLRNIIIALGAMLGFNKRQWKGLVKGIIKKKGAVVRI
jgi:hypothetical protein